MYYKRPDCASYFVVVGSAVGRETRTRGARPVGRGATNSGTQDPKIGEGGFAGWIYIRAQELSVGMGKRVPVIIALVLAWVLIGDVPGR